MKRSILAGAVLLGSSFMAQAADLPARVAPSAPIVTAPLFTWTGFYLGLNAGVGFTDSDVTTTGFTPLNITNVAIGARPGSIGIDSTGFVGGAQLGYNVQLGQFVIGAEADIAYTDLGETTSVIGTGGTFNDFRQELEYLGTVRARLGFAFDRFLIYGTGGLAYGEIKNEANFFTPGNVLQFSGSRSDTEVGYVIGGGVEYAFTNNFTFKAEYLYYDLGNKNVAVNGVPGVGIGGYNSKFENDGHIFRAGLNYKFSLF